MSGHPTQLISAYADGELGAVDAARVRAHLAECPECAAELALIRSIGEAMLLTMTSRQPGHGIWQGVHRGIAPPVGGLLFVAGLVVWLALATLEWLLHGALTLAWLATSAMVTSLALVAVGIAYTQYTQWSRQRRSHLQE